MPVPYTFGTATSAIPLSQLDDNFATPITIGNTAVQLGNTVTTLNNMTLANVTISSGTITITNVAVTTANVSGTANISTLVVVGNETVGGNITITGNITAANANVTTNLVLSGGTANGVAYLNGSKVLTTGSALTFDGTTLVSGTGIRANSYMEIRSNTATLYWENAANTLYWAQKLTGSDFAWDYYNGTSVSEKMRISGTAGGVGAVGIGYTSLTSVGDNGLAVLGNVGIGTSSPLKFNTSGSASSRLLTVFNSGTNSGTRGELQIGNASTTSGDTTGLIMFGCGASTTTANQTAIIYSELTASSTSVAYGALVFGTANGSGATERARITSGGYFKASNTGTYQNATSTYHELRNDANANTVRISNTIASGYTDAIVQVSFTAYAPNTTNSWFLFCDDSTTNRVQLRSNGGIANYSANDVNLSDRREKTNFSPATSYLDKICSIPVQTFNYIDQNMEDDGGLTLGVVAQDVQAVAPELVMESNWAKDGDEPKMRLSIYQTDLQYALMKCIQEQQSIIQSLTARITALEGA